jgi:hypothetical protein
MQLVHRRLHVAGEALRKDLQGLLDRCIDRGLLLRRRAIEDVVRTLGSRRRLADADAQPPIVVAADALRDVPQAVVAGDSAPLLHLHHAWRKVELVVHYEDLFGLDLEEPREHLHRAAARVHEALGHEQPGAARFMPADQRLEFRILAQADAVGQREALEQPEARVVARALVLLARIAETYD